MLVRLRGLLVVSSLTLAVPPAAAQAARSIVPVRPARETGTPGDSLAAPRFTLEFLHQLATLQERVQSVVAADPVLAAAWAVRATPALQAQLVVTTPALQTVYTAAGLSPHLVAQSLQQLREIYLRAQALRTQHPGADVTTLVDATMGDPRWVANFRFVESHRQDVAALGLTVPKLPQLLPVMTVVDSTDPFPEEGRGPRAPPLRVLFIGNSLTYINDVPALFRTIAANGLHRRVVTQMVTLSGAALRTLWQEGTGVAAQVLVSAPWDVVVLQGRPEQTAPVSRSASVHQNLGAFDTVGLAAVVRAVVDQLHPQQTRVLLYVPSQGDEGSVVGAVMDSLHSHIGRAVGIPVVHAGAVVDRFKRAHAAVRPQLFLPDGSHQSALGAYLQALVLYTTLTQQSPVGVPHPVLPGLSDSLATLFQLAAAGVGLMAPGTPLSRPLPTHPLVLAELYTDLTCASCASAASAVMALSERSATPHATVVPLIWPVGVASLSPPDAARHRLARALGQPSTGGRTASPPLDTMALAIPTVVVDGVRTTVDALSQAVRQAAQRHPIDVTAAMLDNRDHFGVLVDAIPTASATDSLDVWAVVTEDRVVPDGPPGGPGSSLAVVRAAHLLQTVGARQGSMDMFQEPALPSDVAVSRTHLVILVQTHDQGRIVGVALVPLPVFTGTIPH